LNVLKFPNLKFPRKTLTALLLLTVGAGSPVSADEKTRALMDQVFDAVAYLLPLSVRDAEKTSEWDRELIDEKLAVLRGSADALASHAEARAPEFGLLARSFDDTVKDIDSSFREEWPTYAYFSLMELTQHCVACHSRQPAQVRDEFSQRLMSRVNMEIFDDSELAQLYVATRQFDAAESTLARKLLDPGQDAIDLDIAGFPLDYLGLALGVTRSVDDADTLLARFAERADAPYYLRERVAHWRARLKTLAPALKGPADLAAARKIFQTASSEFRGTRDRRPAVDDLVAAALLQRYVDEQAAASGPAVAEAYYMLGMIALRTLEPKYSVPEMEILLASAIEADPHGPFAMPSYLLLEEFGFVRDVPLSRVEESGSKLLDMLALRKLSEPAANP